MIINITDNYKSSVDELVGIDQDTITAAAKMIYNCNKMHNDGETPFRDYPYNQDNLDQATEFYRLAGKDGKVWICGEAKYTKTLELYEKIAANDNLRLCDEPANAKAKSGDLILLLSDTSTEKTAEINGVPVLHCYPNQTPFLELFNVAGLVCAMASGISADRMLAGARAADAISGNEKTVENAAALLAILVKKAQTHLIIATDKPIFSRLCNFFTPILAELTTDSPDANALDIFVSDKAGKNDCINLILPSDDVASIGKLIEIFQIVVLMAENLDL